MFGNILALLTAFLVAPTTSPENQASTALNLRSNPVTHPTSYQAGIAHQKMQSVNLRSSIQEITDYREIRAMIETKEFLFASVWLINKYNNLADYENSLYEKQRKLQRTNPHLAEHLQNQMDSLETERVLLELLTTLEQSHAQYLASVDYQESFTLTSPDTTND